MNTSSFAEAVQNQIKSFGLDAKLISEKSDNDNFGNAIALFSIGHLILRIVNDRGERFLDMGSVTNIEKFYQYDDVEVAMSWKSIDDVLAKKKPEPLDAVLNRFRARIVELQNAFSGDQEQFTRAKIERAAKKRSEAFLKRLRKGPGS